MYTIVLEDIVKKMINLALISMMFQFEFIYLFILQFKSVYRLAMYIDCFLQDAWMKVNFYILANRSWTKLDNRVSARKVNTCGKYMVLDRLLCIGKEEICFSRKKGYDK